MFIKNPDDDKFNRVVIVKDQIYPPATISIDGRNLNIKNVEKEVGFYKSGIVIQSQLEKIKNKRKFLNLNSN